MRRGSKKLKSILKSRRGDVEAYCVLTFVENTPLILSTYFKGNIVFRTKQDGYSYTQGNIFFWGPSWVLTAMPPRDTRGVRESLNTSLTDPTRPDP